MGYGRWIHTGAASIVLSVSVAVGPASGQSGVGFRLDLGYQELGREWGEVLDGAVDGEFSLMYGLAGLRAGVGVNWSSLGVTGVEERSWQHTTAHVLLGYGHAAGSGLRPFGEIRYLRRSARPEGARLFDEEAAEQPIGPFRARGDGVGVRLGVEAALTERSTLALSGERQWFSTEPDPLDRSLGAVGTGTSWRLGAGLTWFSGGGRAGPRSGASGDEPDPGLSIGVGGSLGLLAPWTWNEYVKGKPFTSISPRSWRRGVTNGFAWDDNKFDVNYQRHPYQGQVYFNAARANGYGFGLSALYALVGSYLWECCTETHIASIPDMVTTVVGGAAYGESIHRLSSRVLDDAAVGSERVLRETVAALLNPSRAVSRLVTGRSWAVRPDASGPGGVERRIQDGLAQSEPRGGAVPSPDDRPLVPSFSAGARSTRIWEPGERRMLPFLAIEWGEGDLLGSDEGIFSYHRLRVGLHPGDHSMIGRVHLRGALWRGGVSQGGGRASRFSAFVEVDYVNTRAYRFAAQGVSGSWALGLPVAERTELRLETGASLVLMGSADSKYARFAEIRGVRERLREYDFGAGPGGRIAISLSQEGDPHLAASYRILHLGTLNGSNVEGSRSSHLLHLVGATARQRISAGWSLGIDLDLFLRDSEYGFEAFDDEFVGRSEARLYLTWRPNGI